MGEQPAAEPRRVQRRFPWTRETRLLLLTVGLSLTVLLLLARFRFPDQEPLELPTQPLQRLAARAAFDDLSAAVARAADRVRPSLRVVSLPAPAMAARSVTLEDVLWSPPEEFAARLALAYRFRADAAVVLAQTPAWSAAGGPLPAGPSVLASDDLRGLALLDLREEADDAWQPLSVSSPLSPQYLLLAEATPGGIAVRPLFGGAADPFVDPQWDLPILALGRDVRAPDGAFIFSLEGAFVGAVINRHGAHGIVPADLLLRTAERLLAEGARTPATIGVRLQRLDLALMTATGATSGALVAEVAPDSPAAAGLEPGDVVTAVAERAVDSPEAALMALARLPVGAPSPLDVLRRRERLQVTVTPVALQEPPTMEDRNRLGAALHPVAAGSYVLSVARSGPAAAAGLRDGDVITWIPGASQPSPQRVQAAWEQLEPGASLLIRVRRDDEPVVVALTKHPAAPPR